MRLGMKVGVGPGDIVLDGVPAPLPPLPSEKERGTASQFSAHVCYGEKAGLIKMSLGTEVGLGAGHIVLDGEPPPSPPKKGHSPQFSVHVYCGQTVSHLSYC